MAQTKAPSTRDQCGFGRLLRVGGPAIDGIELTGEDDRMPTVEIPHRLRIGVEDADAGAPERDRKDRVDVPLGHGPGHMSQSIRLFGREARMVHAVIEIDKTKNAAHRTDTHAPTSVMDAGRADSPK